MGKITLERARDARTRWARGESARRLAVELDLSVHGVYELLHGHTHSYAVRVRLDDQTWDRLARRAQDEGCNVEHIVLRLVQEATR